MTLIALPGPPDKSMLPVFVINLDRDVDRMASVRAQVPEAVRVPAVDGRAMSDDEVRANTTPACRLLCSRSMIGCYLSHAKVWALVARSASPQRAERALVLEDDVLLDPDFRAKAAAAARRWPDADLIHLGCTDMCAALNALSGNLFVYASAYLISRAGADRLLRERGRANYHADLSMALAGLEVRVLSPPVALQDTRRFPSGQFEGAGALDRLTNTVMFQVGGCQIVTLKMMLLAALLALAARPTGGAARGVACAAAAVLLLMTLMSAFTSSRP